MKMEKGGKKCYSTKRALCIVLYGPTFIAHSTSIMQSVKLFTWIIYRCLFVKRMRRIAQIYTYNIKQHVCRAALRSTVLIKTISLCFCLCQQNDQAHDGIVWLRMWCERSWILFFRFAPILHPTFAFQCESELRSSRHSIIQIIPDAHIDSLLIIICN